MSPVRAFRAALVTLLVIVGCSDESAVSLPRAEAETPSDLEFSMPLLDREARLPDLVVPVEVHPGPAGPAASDDYEPTQILSASTTVGFMSNYAYSTGRHRYTGNVGRVDTEAVVTFGSQELGRQPAHNQDYVPFLLDFGQVRDIAAEAYVFTDQECGLEVDGDSNHWAGRQWFLGGQAPDWGDESMSTQAFPPAQQPACAEEEEPYDGGELPPGSESEGAEGENPVTCWYWVTYDPVTGEVYDAQFLYCDDPGEGG
jgi:hypothetical protein